MCGGVQASGLVAVHPNILSTVVMNLKLSFPLGPYNLPYELNRAFSCLNVVQLLAR